MKPHRIENRKLFQRKGWVFQGFRLVRKKTSFGGRMNNEKIMEKWTQKQWEVFFNALNSCADGVLTQYGDLVDKTMIGRHLFRIAFGAAAAVNEESLRNEE